MSKVLATNCTKTADNLYRIKRQLACRGKLSFYLCTLFQDTVINETYERPGLSAGLFFPLRAAFPAALSLLYSILKVTTSYFITKS